MSKPKHQYTFLVGARAAILGWNRDSYLVLRCQSIITSFQLVPKQEYNEKQSDSVTEPKHQYRFHALAPEQEFNINNKPLGLRSSKLHARK